ncbi:coiled-coil domain-containing protein [Slackia exigua]|uniref:coiled-coil domain-containing protein n=1 Tax=Slackia exigua TaxID=84109 RepID=UPI003AB96F12
MNTPNAALTRRAFFGGAAAFGVALALPKGAYADDPAASDVKARASAARDKLNDMTVRLGKSSDAYNQALEDYDTAVASMDDAQTRIEENDARIEDLQSRLGTRARSMYREGQTTFLDIFLGSSSFDDFVRNWDALTDMNSQDADMVAQTKDLRVDNEIQKETYAQAAATADQKLQEADAEKQNAEALIKQYQAEVDSLDSQVAELLEQEQQAAAAEAASAAASVGASAPAASNGGSSGSGSTSGSSSSSSSNSSDSAPAAPSHSDSDSDPDAGSDSDSRPSAPSRPSSPSHSHSSDSSSSRSSSGGSNSYGSAILAAAESQLGVPYVYGGTEPGVGLDCSGLTSYCWQEATGRWIGRTTDAQYASADWIGSPSQAQVGDVLYKDGHVAICASAGAGSYIHAPLPGKVVQYCSASWWNPWTAALRWN